MIKKTLSLLLFFSLVYCWGANTAISNQYYYNSNHSTVKFELKHFGLITVQGEFRQFSGKATFDVNNLENSSVTISIQTATVLSDNSTRDQSLMSDKFFWSEKFPNIEFLSRKFIRVDDRHFDIHGDLTIRGISNPVIFKTELLSDPSNLTSDQHLSFKSETTIKRKDYNLGVDALANPIMFITDEKLVIRLDVKCLPV